MKGFIFLAFFSFLFISCGDIQDDANDDLGVRVGRRAIIGQEAFTDAERALGVQICDAIEDKERNFSGSYPDWKFNYVSTISENGCSAGADDLTHNMQFLLRYDRRDQFYTLEDDTNWSGSTNNERAHGLVSFEGLEGRGVMRLDDFCSRMDSNNSDRVINVEGTNNYAYYLRLVGDNTIQLDADHGIKANDYSRDKFYSISVDVSGSSANNGLVTRYQRLIYCNTDDRKYHRWDARLSGRSP